MASETTDVEGLPFDRRPAPGPRYDPANVIPIDPRYGSSVLPGEMDDEEDDCLYDSLIP